ncbi:MAG: hypothetical protein M1457_01460 [bacterium]|nr:hypothetical protein [bacterium]
MMALSALAWLVAAGCAYPRFLMFHLEDARWGIKTSLTPAAEAGARAGEGGRFVPMRDLLELPGPPGVARDDPRYERRRIPPFANPLGLAEGDLVTTIGWLQFAGEAIDGDYHLQLSLAPGVPTPNMIVEIPVPDARFVDSVELRECFGHGREFVRGLLGGAAPTDLGTVLDPPARVRVTGQLFYDDAYVGRPPRGKASIPAATLWEIHPVVEIAAAPPAP